MKHPNKSYWTASIDISKGTVEASHKFSERFVNDKVFVDSEYCLLIADGLLLNKYELFAKYGVANYTELLLSVMNSTDILRDFRGPFSGLVYNKKNGVGYAWGNQTGDMPLFYHLDEINNVIVVSTSFAEINSKLSKEDRSLDEKMGNQLLTYGFGIGNHTLNKGCRRLHPGMLIGINKLQSGVQLLYYHSFKCGLSRTEKFAEEYLPELDRLFRVAVERCFKKDIEYGYSRHWVDISAGLDSRMVNRVAKELGFTRIINTSYSESATDEDNYARDLHKHLLNEYYHESLNDAAFLFDIDSITEEIYGLAYYCGITGGWRWLNLLNFDNLGCEHTGQLGDVVVGAFSNAGSKDVNPNSYRNSKLLKLHIEEDINYDSQEEFLLYTRGFQGALATHFIRNNYTYALSPFLDVDFMEYCFSIPYSVRRNHRLYWAWIDLYYPDIAKLPSSRRRIVNPRMHFARKVIAKLNAIRRNSLTRIGFKSKGYVKNHMNPHDLWYNEVKGVREFINSYYNDNITLLNPYPEVKSECTTLFNNGNALEKLMAISLLAGVKRWCR